MDKKLAQRSILTTLLPHLKENEISVILGPRQAGKTTIIKELMTSLTKDGVLQNRIYSFNLDVLGDSVLFQNQTDFIAFIKNRSTDGQKLYIFVDEAQKVPKAGVFFKGVYDLNLPVKIVLTGSSSLDLTSKINEPLTGRKKIFKLFPLSFFEYLQFKDENLISFLEKKDKFANGKIISHLFDFIISGGYPKVALEEDFDKKISYLQETYTSYIEKDIVKLLRVKNYFSLSSLVKILSSNMGNLLNIDKFGDELSLKSATVARYLAILEETFVVSRVRPFFTSSRAEIRKMPKVYFFDTGMRNFSKYGDSFLLNDFKNSEDKGALLENFIFNELQKSGFSTINFWRTKDGAEVDFVVEINGEKFPIEVKALVFKTPDVSRSFNSFIQKFQPKKGFIVNLGMQKEIQKGKTEINFCLPFELIPLLTNIQKKPYYECISVFKR